MFTLPNLITLLNLFFGCLAAISILNGAYYLGIIFSLAGGLADFLDGMVARLLNVQSNIGKELDSLADMVSFGFVPGIIFYKLISLNLPWPGLSVINWYAVPAFLITMFSALRLAKFNLDNRQTESFIGMPTPAATV
ncbi:MAG: CDP-alcohol phosphatidyltransferase family protein, partial [Saprospiraceae bacterium]|nr:CDP-alcohol phosphatidyltransferase family protein [Saprospiraceae bacterium]